MIRYHTWDDVYVSAVARGETCISAAWRADLWGGRQHRPPVAWRRPPQHRSAVFWQRMIMPIAEEE